MKPLTESKVAIWIEIERTKSPVLFRVSFKIGNAAFSKPKVMTPVQVIKRLAGWLERAAMPTS